MFKEVKDKILYKATNRDYKVGEKYLFGGHRNRQAERVYAQNFLMKKSQISPSRFLNAKVKNNELLTMEEIKDLVNQINNYEFCLREIGMERCREKYFPDSPSRLEGMFLTDNLEKAKDYAGCMRGRKNESIVKAENSFEPKVCVIKLNGKLLKTDNSFNQRDGRSIDQFEEQAKQYFNGIADDYEHEYNEYLFEGVAEIVDIIK